MEATLKAITSMPRSELIPRLVGKTWWQTRRASSDCHVDSRYSPSAPVAIVLATAISVLALLSHL
jgi:hypothetical protein